MEHVWNAYGIGME